MASQPPWFRCLHEWLHGSPPTLVAAVGVLHAVLAHCCAGLADKHLPAQRGSFGCVG